LISQLNGNLVVRFSDYRTNELFLSFLGNHETDETARQLTRYSREIGLAADLRLIPEVSIRGISRLHVQEDRDNFDYLYSTRQHVELTGPDFKRARNFVRKFEREHANAAFHILNYAETRVRDMVFEVLRRWKNSRSGNLPEIDHERDAIDRILKTISLHSLLATGVCVGDTLLGFSIDELLPNGYCICHFCKADIRCLGIYDYLFHHKAMQLIKYGCEFINGEQDLGIAGLRQSKISYRPMSLLKKYRIGAL
jgi:hypothetical protein